MADVADLPRGEQDGLPIPDVGSWAHEKYLRVWMYGRMFAAGMKDEWPAPEWPRPCIGASGIRGGPIVSVPTGRTCASSWGYPGS